MLANGVSVDEAARRSIELIMRYYPQFTGALIVANISGGHGKVMAVGTSRTTVN